MSSWDIERDRLARELKATGSEERRLWAMVKGKHRGQAGHDPRAWKEWMAAAARVQFIAGLLRGAAGHSQPQKKGISWG